MVMADFTKTKEPLWLGLPISPWCYSNIDGKIYAYLSFSVPESTCNGMKFCNEIYHTQEK